MTFAWRHYSRLLTLATAAAETEYTRGNSAPRHSGAGEGVAPWYTIGALSRYARARHEVGTRFLQHETMRVRPASLASPARHGVVCCYLAQYYDVSFS